MNKDNQIDIFFKELFLYNQHCNQKLFDLFILHQEKAVEKALGLYSHILNAHQIWNVRIEPTQPPYGIWQIHPLDSCKEIDKINYENNLSIIDKFDINSISNFKKNKAIFSIRDMLFHIINHATYHRAQIATEFREHGIEPLGTDYIFFKK